MSESKSEKELIPTAQEVDNMITNLKALNVESKVLKEIKYALKNQSSFEFFKTIISSDQKTYSIVIAINQGVLTNYNLYKIEETEILESEPNFLIVNNQEEPGCQVYDKISTDPFTQNGEETEILESEPNFLIVNNQEEPGYQVYDIISTDPFTQNGNETNIDLTKEYFKNESLVKRFKETLPFLFKDY